jgi:predicted small lipoprotein YifL
MRSALLRTGTILLLLAAAGCGQKGSLYLPDKTRTPVPAGGSATPAPVPAAQPGNSGS